MCTAVSFREKGEKGGLLWPVVPSVCLSEKFLSLPLAEPKTPLTRRPPFLPPSLGRSEKVSPRKADNSVQLTVSLFFPSRKKGRGTTTTAHLWRLGFANVDVKALWLLI